MSGLVLSLLFLVLQRLTEAEGDVNQGAVNEPVLVDGFGERNGDDVVAAQGDHASEFAAVDHVDGADAVTRGQDAIEGAGRSAALNVAEHDVAGLEASTALDFAGHDLADAAEAHMAEFVLAHLGEDGRALGRIDIAGELGAFGDDDDAEVTSTGMAQADALGDFLDVERLFGDEDYVGTASDAAVHGDPSGIAAHDFDHHDALVRFGGG